MRETPGRTNFARANMHVTSMISIAASAVAMAAFAWQKQWLPSSIYAFSLSYAIFDKVFPALLPEALVTGFAVISLVLALIFCWKIFSRKRAA